MTEMLDPCWCCKGHSHGNTLHLCEWCWRIDCTHQRRSKRPASYDRDVLVEILVYHYRSDITGCGCGWAELGRSWPEHVATVYEESVAVRCG